MNAQIIGNSQPVKSEPRNVLPENHGKPQAQTIGTTMPLQTVASNVKYGAGTRSGQFQVIGEQIKMSDAPVLGYQSANTPMSNRAVDSKKGF